MPISVLRKSTHTMASRFYRATAKHTHILSVSLSVRLSNECIVTKQTKVLPTFLYHMNSFGFPTQKNGWWGTSPCTWNFGPNWPHGFKNGDLQSIFARSASTLRSSEKRSIVTNRKSTTSFPMSLKVFTQRNFVADFLREKPIFYTDRQTDRRRESQ